MQQLPEYAGAIVSLPPDQAHETIQHGIPIQRAIDLADSLSLTGDEIAQILNLSNRTFNRWKLKKQSLDSASSNQFYRLSEIAQRAIDTFGSLAGAKQWLDEEQQALGFRKPIAMIATAPGAQAVERLLGRIQRGVYT